MVKPYVASMDCEQSSASRQVAVGAAEGSQDLRRISGPPRRRRCAVVTPPAGSAAKPNPAVRRYLLLVALELVVGVAPVSVTAWAIG